MAPVLQLVTRILEKLIDRTVTSRHSGLEGRQLLQGSYSELLHSLPPGYSPTMCFPPCLGGLKDGTASHCSWSWGFCLLLSLVALPSDLRGDHSHNSPVNPFDFPAWGHLLSGPGAATTLHCILAFTGCRRLLAQGPPSKPLCGHRPEDWISISRRELLFITHASNSRGKPHLGRNSLTCLWQ